MEQTVTVLKPGGGVRAVKPQVHSSDPPLFENRILDANSASVTQCLGCGILIPRRIIAAYG